MGLEADAREAQREIVSKLVHHHGWRQRRVVAKSAAGVGHEEGASRREQGLQEGESVLVTRVAVSPPGGGRRDEIEGGGVGRARELAAVQPDDAYDLGGEDRARRETRHRDSVREAGRLGRGLVRPLAQGIPDEVERERAIRRGPLPPRNPGRVHAPPSLPPRRREPSREPT